MRNKYEAKRILLVSQMQVEYALNLVVNAPVDPLKPLELILREKSVTRNDTQNSLMWAGALNDIASQAWVNGRQYSAEAWHEYFKREYLPEQFIEGITKEGYAKWDYMPTGERVLIGSTTQLTTGGFSEYLEKIYADGANLGVRFSQ